MAGFVFLVAAVIVKLAPHNVVCECGNTDLPGVNVEIQPSKDVWTTGYHGQFYNIIVCMETLPQTAIYVNVNFVNASGCGIGFYGITIKTNGSCLYDAGTPLPGFSYSGNYVDGCCQAIFIADDAIAVSFNQTAMQLMLDSKCIQRIISIQNCTDGVLHSNASVSSDNPTYLKDGNFRCKNNGKLYNSSSHYLPNQTVCRTQAKWDNEDEVQCWYEPDVTMEGVGVELNNFTFTVNESESLKVLCKFDDVHPTGNTSSYFFNNTNCTKGKDEPYETSLLMPSDNQKQISCQAVTPYTSVQQDLGRSLPYIINVQYAPYSEDSNDCSCCVDQNCSCNISFFSNPSASFVSLKKDGMTIIDAPNNLSLGGMAYQQLYTFTKDMVKEDDAGNYSVVLQSALDNDSFIMFQVKVFNATSKPPPSPSPSNIPYIIGGVAGVALIIVVILLIWCCRRKKPQKSGSDEKEQRVNPLYVPADHSEQLDEAYAKVETRKPVAESSEKEERQNPLYESSNPPDQDQVAYAVVEKKKMKKGKKHEKELCANPIYVPSDSHGTIQDAYATVEKKTNGKTKKGKKVDQIAMTPIGGNNMDVAYAEVDKTKKKSSKDHAVVASVDSNNQAAGTSAAAEYAEVKKTKPKKSTKPVQGTTEDKTSDLHGSDMNSVIKEKPPVPSRRHQSNNE